MKKIITILLIFSTLCVTAQNRNKKDFELSGIVTNISGEAIKGALVTIQESFNDAETDDKGYFTITVPKMGAILIVYANGYDEKFIEVTSENNLNIRLEKEHQGQGSRDIVHMPWYDSYKRDLTGAVSTIGYEELRKSPVMSLGSALVGRVSGLNIKQNVGLPGDGNPQLRVRGMRTLESGGQNGYDVGGIGTPLIIVDGFERSFYNFDPSEIESFSVLKDAAATALYGMRGANGVILVNTKRGQLNRRNITVDVGSGFVTPTVLPEFMDSYEYATLYNEARINDGLDPIYTDKDLELYKNGKSPLTHPNVNYYDEFIKKAAWQRNASLTITGGNRHARYFIVAGYRGQDGLFDRNDENPEFKTKINYNRFNLRSNLDVNITDWILLSADIAGRIEERRYPKTNVDDIMNVLSSYPSNAIPISFMGVDPELNKEILMLGGNTIYKSNPLALLSYDGYNENTRRYYQLSARLNVDLTKYVTPGLGFSFSYYMDGYNLYRVEVGRKFRTWEYSIDNEGNPLYTPFGQETSIDRSGFYTVNRYNGLDAKIYYNRIFGKHKVNAFVLYNQQRTEFRQANYCDQKWQNLALMANYSYDNKYFIDLIGSYMGNDNFYWMNKKKDFYPAVGFSWSIGEEKFMKYAKDYLDFLKLRVSYGITGNDQYAYEDVNGLIERYPSRDRWWSFSKGHCFGTALTYVLLVRKGRVPNKDLRVEKGRMLNIGIEAALFKNRLTFSADLWAEHRYNIYTVGVGSLPWVIGVTNSKLPITNDGIVDSKGLEISLGWKDQIGKFKYSVGGYVNYADSKIIEMGEPYREFTNLIQTNNRVKQGYGLISLGLFKDQADIDSSPEQTFGPYQPGDIKYKDVNQDGIINQNDITKIGEGMHPRLNCALELYLDYAGLYLNVLFQGVGYRTGYLSNNATKAFVDNGNISHFAANRFHTNPDGTTNYETADYPRLTTLSNDNNWRASTFWMKDISFLRLQNVELGYALPKKILKNTSVDGVKFYVNMYNALTISNLKNFEPEDISSGINRYPQIRIFNFGITLTF